MSKLMDGVYISGFLTDGDKTELDSIAQELHEKGVPFYVRNLSGVIMQSAFDFADFELIAIAYPVFREFVMNGGYDLAKYFVLRLWNLVTKGRNSKIPFTVTIEGIPTTTGIETIKCKISEPLSRKAQEKVVDKAFELASQIENHQYQLLDRSRYFDALNGHIFNYDAASETLTEINIEEELQKRVQKHNDNAN